LKNLLLALALTLSTSISQAAVQPIDLNADGHADAFLDEAHGLLWINANTIAPQTFNAAKSEITAFTIEGITSWRMPTVSEYKLLYQTQGGDGSGILELPFTVPYNNYWSSDADQTLPGQNLTFATHTVGGFTTVPHSLSTLVGVWAVSSVPEVPSLALLLAGLLLFRIQHKRRRGDA
jgi:hypothetical protein